MSESLRLLLYPLGYLANLLFGARFIVQWLGSERKKKSYVPQSFWLFSSMGNILLALHAFIQLQFPILFFQTLGALISLRNLDLQKEKPLSLRKTLAYGTTILIIVSLLFFSQGVAWMRAPKAEVAPLPLLIHILGSGGIFLFASRFWLQWWHAEKKKKSDLTRSFWWMSLIGALLALVYFFYLKDPVNLLGYGLGIIPYIRNLHLLKKRRFSFTSRDTLFVLAAEKSGDQLGASLLQEFKELSPSTRIVGVGGEAIKAEGAEILISSEEFEVMGLIELLPAARRLFKNFHKIKRLIEQERPKAIVLIDYAEFNMLLARSLRKGGYQGKIIQYVIPSIWAWRKGRIKTLSKHYDLLLSILPFEKEYFKEREVKVSFVGHPLFKLDQKFVPKSDWKEDLHLPKQPLLALFPGSRSHEIEENLPSQLEVAKELSLHCAISVASPKLQKRIEEFASKASLPYTLVPAHYRHELMQECTVALATSGTIVLELALLKTPTVVLYKIPYVNYLVGRYLFRINIPYFSLPNILLQRTLFPELVDKKIDRKRLLEMVDQVMKSKTEVKEGCAEVQELLREKKRGKAAEELYALFVS